VRAFQARAWPGNVRELRNAVARAISLGLDTAAGAGAPHATSPSARTGHLIDPSIPLLRARDAVLEDFERAYVAAVLEQCGGNITRAAELAGVNRKFIQRAIKRYGLRDSDAD
jgi:DNA-binding NtrC family response regulator